MTQTEHLWLLCSLWQVALLTCDLRSQHFEVEVMFEPFPSKPEADSYTATCGPAGNPLIFSKRIDRSACSPDCRLRLHMSEDHRRCSIQLRASRNDSVLETKTLHFIPVSVSSFSISSTTTTAHLKWEPLHRQQSISTLTLYNMHTQSVTGIYNISSPEIQSKFTMKNLQPGTRYMVEVLVATFQTQPGIKLTQKLSIFLESDQCPHGWLANGRSCYTVKRSGLSWGDAMSSCTRLVGGSHLADLKTLEDLLFVSSHLQTDNNLLLLWTGLNDQQEEGHPLWSDGSPYNQTDTVTTLLPASQADCFVFQKNATGPGYFLTPFFCDIPLPFICQYQTPSTPASFSFNLAQVTDQQVELRWSDLSALRSPHFSSFEIILQYRESESALPGHDEEDGCKDSEGGRVRKSQPSFAKTFRVPISLSSREVTLTGLSPGSIYFFTLQVSQHAGPSWSLGQTQTAYTKPLPPQSIAIGSVTASQITVHWMLPDTQCASEWEFAVLCVDVSSRQERVVSNVSRVFGTNRMWFCTAMIGGLESYTRYRIEVFTITKFGIWSCGPAPLTVRTAVEAPADLVMFTMNDSLSVCWTVPPRDPPDAYYVATQSFNSPAASSLWINDSSSGGLGKDESICANLAVFTPGHTYEVAVVAVRGNDRSERSINIHTTAPMPVQVAVPLSVGTNYTQVYVQPPRVGLFDGVKVCACLGVCNRTCKGWCEYTCEWHALPAGIYIATISSLTPGSEYQLSVYSTMKGRVGPPFYTHPIKTSLAPPSRVREGVVTDSSVELLWDPAPGQGQRYEVSCLNCDHGLKVQKVFGQSAVFSGLTPGSLYRFAVRTEKESFTDSSPVSINITAVPGQAEVSLVNKTTSSICISWSAARGVLSSFVLSIRNTTSVQELIISLQERRSYNFQGLAPGSQYTVELITANRERRSRPSTLILYTLPEMPSQVVTSEHPVTSVFLSWRPPAGQVDKYKLGFGLLSSDRKSWTKVFVESTSYEFTELIPGTDYGVSVQSVLGSETSYAANRKFSTWPAGLCSLHLDKVDSSSFSVSWSGAPGEFDFHRVTVANASLTRTLAIPKEERVAVVTGLLDGCSYNVSAKRVRGVTAGSAAFLTVTTEAKPVRGVRLVVVSARAFSLRWLQAEGCVDVYQVSLLPNQGTVTIHPAHDGYIQADVVDVSPGTQYSVTVSAASSSKGSPGVSRMITTNESVPGPPQGLEGEAVGSNGILLSWSMQPDANSIDEYIIRYKEVCPYPDTSFTQVTKYLDVPETLITDFTSGSTYHIQVAAVSPAGIGQFSKPLYIKTSESPPGLVTNLTAYAQNHTFVMVTWFLPHRINGLITKFAVKAKHARTGQTVRMLEVNAEEIMTGALPHCNDAADILSRATPNPLEITASSPPITLSAVPPAASWNVPISVGVDQLRPYTAYLFEVSAFTSDGEGQVASTMVRMPESAPEDPPKNLAVLNMTSRSISVSWNSPSIITGKFTYVLYLYGPTGFLHDNSTWDMRFLFTGLAPYTRYRVAVRAKAAGEVGPAAQEVVVTPTEAPSAVQNLEAVAEDSVSIRVSWRIPAQPNGPITQYRLQVLADDTLLQEITLTSGNITDLYKNQTLPPYVDNTPRRRKRSDEFGPITSPPAFTATVSVRTPPTAMTASSLARSESRSTDRTANTDFQSTLRPTPLHESSPGDDSESITQSSDKVASRTSVPSVISVSPSTPPPWLIKQSHTEAVTSAASALGLTPGQLRLSTRDASVTGHISTRSAAGVTVREEVVDVLSEELSYLVSDLNPFTEYTFRVSASTTAGEGPAADITEKTSEQVPSSVLEVSYQNLSSTSILVNWVPPLHPNGRITHYSVYGINLRSNQALKWVTNTTSILISDLDKYTGYKLRVAASTAVGESSEEDDVFVFTLEDEPDSPPENLSVVETSPSTATLTWSAPEKANGVIQYYEVFYENESYSAMTNSTTNRVTLISLTPFSFYNVSVRAYTRYGNGNQTSETLYLLSGEDVPGSPPYGLSYDSVSPSEVNVTWYAPLQPNGVITHYSLELWNSTHHLNLTSPTDFLHITHLRKYAQYRIVVQAHTRAGPGNYSSEPLNITTLEDAPDTPPQFLKAKKLSDYEVELSWEPPLNANSEILYYIVRVWNETAETWQNVTETSVVINVDSESRYNASVSSWTSLGDGGVLIFISFTTTEAEPFDPPQNVTVVNVTASSVTLMWQPPTEPNGIIVHYTIYYTDNSTVTEKRVPVSDLPVRYSPDSPFIYTLTHLLRGSNYTMWMTSSTIQGHGGVQSEPINLLLPEDVPGDPVSNLTAQIFSSTAIIVSWDPPTEPNGRPYYILTLQEAGIFPNMTSPGTPAVNKTIRQSTTDNVFLFTRLRKYFPYVLTVTPATGAGPAYNQTSTMYLRTDDDIPSSPPLLLSTRNLSSSSIAVVWQRPLEANGEITEYTLTLSGPGGTNTTQTPNSSVIFTDLESYTAYNLTIIASTRKGAGPSLLVQLHTDEGGPSSPPRNLTIYNHTAVSVWLTWEPPLEPNGVVIKYGFRIQDLITQTVTHRNSSGPSTAEHLSGFRPHSSYEISVYSYTRVGHGNQFSSPVTFTTNESVSDAVGNLSCSGWSWDSVKLSWEVPANPNGQILFYEITTEIDMQTFTHQAHAPEYTVTGLSPDQEYALAVAAVNSAGPGDRLNCTAFTLSESVPTAPRFLSVSEVTATNVTLQWALPVSVPGLLKGYHVVAQLISTVCEPNTRATALPTPEDDLASNCVEGNFTVSVNASDSAEESSVTIQSLAKYRYYGFKVAAVTNAGTGEYTLWSYARTLPGNPDAPPRDLKVTPTSTSLRIAWEVPAVLSGPTSYLVQVDGPGVNMSIVRGPGELTTVFVTNLTAFNHYAVTVTAFTGSLEDAGSKGKAIGPIVIQTLEEEPKDPPKNVNVSAVPEKVNLVRVSFSPPEEPNGNILAYYVFVYEKDQLVKNMSLVRIQGEPNLDPTVVTFIEGLKGGHTYSIQIAARNGAGRSPLSPHVQITTGIKAPSKPTQRPQAVLGQGGVAMVTHRSITILMPACFYSDDNGPIAKIQVIVAESGVRDNENLTNWRGAYFHRPAPYLTDAGFPNPTCLARERAAGADVLVRGGHSVSGDVPSLLRHNHSSAGTYVIGESDYCFEENNTDHFCNGPLKPNTVYVFKFRATNINGQYTDSEFSEHIRTAADGLLTKEEQIILGVLLSSFLALLLILLICCSVKIHQRKKEGGTYSPREAEIIETKCKLDQLIAVADMELKQEKLNRYSSFFFRRKEIYVIQLLSYRKSLKPVNKKSFLQHVEDLCANDNAKFQEEFSDLPKLLPDLATTDADLPWNKSKNRFLNIKPYNNNRVKLLSEPGIAGSDYINASFVSGYLCPNEFIATQGPLPSTVADFWRMIWETGTRTVAMLTQCYEKGRIRCHKYWPEDHKPMTVFSDILISKVSEEVLPDWTVRTLKVEKHGHYILVKHFNYTSWPEHGVPESCSTLIKFVKAVRAHRHDNSTIVVHCSAGVGRTGVFVALDHLIQHVRDHDFVDIYGLVAELRSERMCMVQNLAQYIFLHQSTLELLNNKGNSQSIWFVNYSALEKMDSLDAMEGDVELEWEETTM